MGNTKFKMVDLRNMVGMTQREWGLILGISEATIQKRETDAKESAKWRLPQVIKAVEFVNKQRGMSITVNDITV